MKNRFQILEEWMPEVLSMIKKEIKTETFPSQKKFYQDHFPARPLNRILTADVLLAIKKELISGNEALGSWIVNRWVLRHSGLYRLFADELTKISSDFSQIKEISLEKSKEILEKAFLTFDPVSVYLFSILNEVVFPKEVVSELKARALEARKLQKEGEISK